MRLRLQSIDVYVAPEGIGKNENKIECHLAKCSNSIIYRDINTNTNSDVMRCIEAEVATERCNSENTHSVHYSPEKIKQYKTVIIDKYLSDESCEIGKRVKNPSRP